ncbi:MAG TPA: hypothetical protein VFV40_05535 [Nocardioides sp.]|nr:hypothetical protein [Nocardioides sp.]
MGPSWLQLSVAILVFVGVVRGLFHVLDGTWRAPAPASRVWRRLRRSRRAAGRPRRPIEVVARDARQLAWRVHHPPRGVSYAKYQAWVATYDRLLVEGCAALEVDHLLEVLEPGDERDRERLRVESLLWLAGLRIDEAA